MKKRRKPLGYNKRSEEQRAYDLKFCADMFLRGYPYRDIADALNKDLAERGMNYTISFQTVYYDLRQCMIEWKRERLDSIDEYITHELRKLDRMEQQAWEAWEMSKNGKTKEKSRTGDRNGYNETSTETTAGNPRYLDVLLNIQQRRAKMLGFDSPVKIEIPGYNTSANDDKPKYDVKSIPDNLLFAVADKLQDAEFQKAIIEKGEKQ